MGKKSWNPHTNVIVCGVESGEITTNGTGSQKFENLFEAQNVFPDLDPKSHSERFTWAMGDPERDVMRFETFAAEKLYSS